MSNEVVNTVTSDAGNEPQIHSVSLVDLLPEDLKSSPSLTKFKDVTALFKAYQHLEGKMGTAIFKPAPDASEDESRAFKDKLKEIPGVLFEPTTDEDAESLLAKLGKPASAADYAFEYPSEDIMNSGIGTQIAEEAFNLGLTQKQAQKMLDKAISSKTRTILEANASEQATITALKAKWGAAYDERMSAARHAVEVMKESFPDSVEEIARSKNPAIIAMLAEIGNSSQEKSVMGSVKDSGFYKTPEYAQEQLNSLQKDKEFLDKFLNKNHPGHRDAVETFTKLSNLMSGVN